MTKRYYQIIMSEIVRKYTAFVTFMGVFEWMRVPMDLKCAASYFQAQIAMVVLAGLVYIVCEIYVDDILVHATSDEEFVERLKLVFERFRKYKLTINPCFGEGTMFLEVLRGHHDKLLSVDASKNMDGSKYGKRDHFSQSPISTNTS